MSPVSSTDDFVHLHVASSASMRYGASHPVDLVARAAELGQPALGLTDRDGLYGAVRFVRACGEAGIAPVLGVDLALGSSPALDGPGSGAGSGSVSGRATASTAHVTGLRSGWGAPDRRGDGEGWGTRGGDRIAPGRGWGETGPDAGPERRAPRSSPVKGGALVDDQQPRVVLLARGQRSGLEPGVGWARLCRLVTHTHLAGERSVPRTTPELISRAAAAVCGAAPVVLLLGPDSDVGRAVLARRRDLARRLLQRWVELVPRGGVRVEVVCHGGPEGSPGSLGHASALWALAREVGIPAVLTAAVRHALPEQARVVDVLDAARRMVALDERHLDRVSSAGHLAGTAAMHALARQLEVAGGPGARAEVLLRDTLSLALECHQDQRSDLGIGAVHLPEPEILGVSGVGQAHQVLTERCA